ncbi:hypothetical protein RJ639_012150 [Escallonia herrerae]|nr:hypothetical protein RJ639_011967 [Escallonia herrerae]KAK3012151.1 hypothetical protein RJ639_012150 [Escallonia herrerae]
MRWVAEEDELEENAKEKIHALILDMSSLINIDSSGILALEELHKKLDALDIKLGVANPRWQVIHKLKLGKFVDKLGSGSIFLTVTEAVDACLAPKMLGA